jgi:hypothetical protein
MAKNEIINEVEVVNEVTEIAEATKPSLLSRIGTGVKTHWKKGVALAAVGALGLFLGTKLGKCPSGEDFDEELIDVDYEVENDPE